MRVARALSVTLVMVALTGHGVYAGAELKAPARGERAANPHQNPFEARSYPERLEIYKGGKKISVIRSSQPNIERWGFIDSGNRVVVRSRGKDGLSALELFDTATGARVEKVLASEVREGKPSWAVDYAN